MRLLHIALLVLFLLGMAFVLKGGITGRAITESVSATLTAQVLLPTSIEASFVPPPMCPRRGEGSIDVRNVGDAEAVGLSLTAGNLAIENCVGCARTTLPAQHRHSIRFTGCVEENATLSIRGVNSNEVQMI